MSDITIYHNPLCSKSRNTLALLEHCGLSPQVVAYLDEPLGAEDLQNLLGQLGFAPSQLIRLSAEECQGLTEEDLFHMMLAEPSLMNRPVMVTPQGARLCRPLSKVFEILPVKLERPFTLEDGSVLLPENQG